MNINVATWGRLMKRAMPQACSDQPNTISPPTCLIAPGKYILIMYNLSFLAITSNEVFYVTKNSVSFY